MSASFNGVDQRTVDLNMRPQSPRLEDEWSLTGRTQVNPSSVLTGRTVNIIFIGQSTNQNLVQTTGTFTHNANIFNLSVAHRGACFTAKEPLLVSDHSGTTFGTFGHHGMYLADQLLADGVVDNVLITNIADGGSFCADWCPGGGSTGVSNGSSGTVSGVFAYRIGLAARCIANAGLSHLPTIIDWQQGEWDSDTTATTQSNYAAALNGVVAECKRVGLLKAGNQMFIHQNTRITNGSTARNAIRAAQASVPDGALVKLGADIDTLDASYRYDDSHFTTAGAAAQAALKKPFYEAYLAA